MTKHHHIYVAFGPDDTLVGVFPGYYEAERCSADAYYELDDETHSEYNTYSKVAGYDFEGFTVQ